MNQRQRKKQFKKKYGMTPAQALELFSDTIRHINDEIIPQMMESVVRCANEIADWAENDLPKIMEEVSRYIREHPAGIMPSEQPEIIRCKDCKNNPEITWFACPMAGKDTRKPNDFCSYAESRNDG